MFTLHHPTDWPHRAGCGLTSMALCLLLAACAQQPATPPHADVTTDSSAHSAPASPPLHKALMAEQPAPGPSIGQTASASTASTYARLAASRMITDGYQHAAESREKYQHLSDNPVKLTTQQAVSTLSLDVDTGSYSNVRRFLNQGQLPPRDAVRVEEMVNYFPYAYPAPMAGHPFSISTEVAHAPWHPDHLLLRVGIKALEQKAVAMPAANLVFLVDVSGSMAEPDKLPLVQASLKMLTQQLRPQDTVALVVYAGRTAVELPTTSGREKSTILAAIERLSAGGSTNGEAALKLAYAQARAGFIKGGINRILLATDGDFNVGISDIEQIKDLVKRERESGISLSTLGFGQGNYQEALMEQIADVGNGNYSYVDSLAEARKVLVDEMSSTFNTVARDVKVQIEFNPAQVAEWRLIGYENRLLREEDFRNDKIDAGDVGAGKSVTALFEITPVGAATLHGERRYGNDPGLRATSGKRRAGDELAFLRLRYQKAEGSRSVELTQAIPVPTQTLSTASASADFRLAAAVAGFGELLRQSPYTGTFTYADVRRLAASAGREAGDDYRTEFLRLVDMAASLTPAKLDDIAALPDTVNE